MLTYIESSVPQDQEKLFRRILCAKLAQAETATIPARPTGYSYIGWIAQGSATATANGKGFNADKGTVHYSGQLTTFDAEYTLRGPAIHYLAELHAYAAYDILNRDIGALSNQVLTLDTQLKDKPHLDHFTDILQKLLPNNVSDPSPEIALAVHKIEAANGAISIAALANELGISDRQLRRRFTRVVGLPPKSFAVCQRIVGALKLMAMNPDLSISDVVYQAGFSDQSHLTNTFQQYLRTTPAKLELDSDGVLRSIVAQS